MVIMNIIIYKPIGKYFIRLSRCLLYGKRFGFISYVYIYASERIFNTPISKSCFLFEPKEYIIGLPVLYHIKLYYMYYI